MNNPLTTEINEAIRKNLPAHLSDELRSQLNRIPELEKANKDLNERLVASESVAAVLRQQIAAANLTIANHGELAKREAAVLKREQGANLLEFKVEAANEARKEMRSIVSEVFANNRFKYSEHYSHPVAMPSNGGYISTAPGSREVEVKS